LPSIQLSIYTGKLQARYQGLSNNAKPFKALLGLKP